MKYYQYELADYDIIGNEQEGFEVNNVFRGLDDIRISEDIVLDDKKLIKALKEAGIIKRGIHNKSIDIEGDPDFTLYFTDIRQEVGGFCPAFELNCIHIYE